MSRHAVSKPSSPSSQAAGRRLQARIAALHRSLQAWRDEMRAFLTADPLVNVEEAGEALRRVERLARRCPAGLGGGAPSALSGCAQEMGRLAEWFRRVAPEIGIKAGRDVQQAWEMQVETMLGYRRRMRQAAQRAQRLVDA